MNENRIMTDRFSDLDSEAMYKSQWPGEPEVLAQYESGQQCGGCSFFAPFNYDWGLCCNPESRHHLETIFEHFTCPVHANEGWGAHSFLTIAQKEEFAQLEREGRASWEELKRRIEAKHAQQTGGASE